MSSDRSGFFAACQPVPPADGGRAVSRPVYRGMSQTELDAQYEQRTLVPDAARYMARWTEWSRTVRAERPPRVVRYGDAPHEVLELHDSRHDGAGFLVLFLHGGAWRSGRAADFAFVVRGLGADGAAVAVAEFSLAPAAALATIVEEVRRAFLAALHRSGGPVVVAGHSSGAHLAACLLDPAWQARAGVPHGALAGLTLVSGIYDLEPVRLSARNDYLHLTEADVEMLSPLRRLPDRPPPTAVVWGERELREFVRQSAVFADAVAARGGAVERLEVAGHNHFAMCDAFGDPDSEVARLVRRQAAAERGAERGPVRPEATGEAHWRLSSLPPDAS